MDKNEIMDNCTIRAHHDSCNLKTAHDTLGACYCSRKKGHKGLHHAHGPLTMRCFKRWV